MNITRLMQPIGSVPTQWLVVGVFEDEVDPPAMLRGTELEAKIRRLAGEKDLTGSLGELTALYEVAGLEARSVLIVGLGPRGRFDPGAAFSAGFAAAKRLAGKSRESVTIALPVSDDRPAVTSALVEGAIAGTRGPGIRKSEINRHAFGTLSLVIDPDVSEADGRAIDETLRRAEIVGNAVNLARDLVNTPPPTNRRHSFPLGSRTSSPRSGSPRRSGMKGGSATSDSADCSALPPVRMSHRASSYWITTRYPIHPRSPWSARA